MISVADLRAFLRAETADDSVLTALELAAVQAVQQRTGRYFGPVVAFVETQTWRGWPMLLSNPPIGGVLTSVELRSGSAWEVVGTDSYYVDGIYLRSNEWSPPDSAYSHPLVRITYQAGYAANAEPEDVRQAVRMLVGHWFEHRETVVVGTIATEIPLGVDALLGAHKRVAF